MGSLEAGARSLEPEPSRPRLRSGGCWRLGYLGALLPRLPGLPEQLRRAAAGPARLALVLRRRRVHHRPVAVAHARRRRLAGAAAASVRARRWWRWAWPPSTSPVMLALAQDARRPSSASGRRARGQPPRALMVGPVPVVPWSREVIIDAGDAYETAVYTAWPRRLRARRGGHPKNDGWPRWRRRAREPRVAAFLVWARFPFWELAPTPGGTAVTVRDVRFRQRVAGRSTPPQSCARAPDARAERGPSNTGLTRRSLVSDNRHMHIALTRAGRRWRCSWPCWPLRRPPTRGATTRTGSSWTAPSRSCPRRAAAAVREAPRHGRRARRSIPTPGGTRASRRGVPESLPRPRLGGLRQGPVRRAAARLHGRGGQVRARRASTRTARCRGAPRRCSATCAARSRPTAGAARSARTTSCTSRPGWRTTCRDAHQPFHAVHQLRRPAQKQTASTPASRRSCSSAINSS